MVPEDELAELRQRVSDLEAELRPGSPSATRFSIGRRKFLAVAGGSALLGASVGTATAGHDETDIHGRALIIGRGAPPSPDSEFFENKTRYHYEYLDRDSGARHIIDDGDADWTLLPSKTADLSVDGAGVALDTTFPGWGSGNAVAVGAAGSDRVVSVVVQIAADVDSLAQIQCQVADADGTMQVVQEWELPAGSVTNNIRNSGAFLVPRGRSYQFTRSGNAGATENVVRYSYAEIGSQ